jgi:tetratricopeptide (TPR) repeat protein
MDSDESLAIGQTLKIPHVLGFKEALDPEGEDLLSDTSDSDSNAQPGSRSLRPADNPEEFNRLVQVFEQGVTAYNRGNYREAMTLFKQVYERDPENQEAYDYFLRAATGMRGGAPVVTDGPSDLTENLTSGAEDLLRRGIAYRDEGNLKDALETFKQASQLYPGHAEIAWNLEKTQDELKKLITAHLNEGIKLFNREALEDAILEWEKVLELDPTNPKATEYRQRAEKMLDALASPQ